MSECERYLPLEEQITKIEDELHSVEKTLTGKRFRLAHLKEELREDQTFAEVADTFAAGLHEGVGRILFGKYKKESYKPDDRLQKEIEKVEKDIGLLTGYRLQLEEELANLRSVYKPLSSKKIAKA